METTKTCQLTDHLTGIRYSVQLEYGRGIYAVICHATGGMYIGATTTPFVKRFRSHRVSLKSGSHNNDKLQSAWSEHGEDEFTFDVIEVVDDLDLLRDREKYWMDYFKDQGVTLYNDHTYAALAKRGTVAIWVDHQLWQRFMKGVSGSDGRTRLERLIMADIERRTNH